MRDRSPVSGESKSLGGVQCWEGPWPTRDSTALLEKSRGGENRALTAGSPGGSPALSLPTPTHCAAGGRTPNVSLTRFSSLCNGGEKTCLAGPL